MIDHKNLKALIKLMVDNDLTELDLHDPQGERITLKRAGGQGGMPAGMGGAMSQHIPGMAMGHLGGEQPGTAARQQGANPPGGGQAGGGAGQGGFGGVGHGVNPQSEGLVEVVSPIVGTFYAAATPEAKPLISVGDRVTPETVVCIIEAMKVFNEIKAETNGTVERILAANGRAVEFGQPLFLVRPG